MKTAIAALTIAILVTGCASAAGQKNLLITARGASYERAIAEKDVMACIKEQQAPYRTADETAPYEMTGTYIGDINAKRKMAAAEAVLLRACMSTKGHTELVVVASK